MTISVFILNWTWVLSMRGNQPAESFICILFLNSIGPVAFCRQATCWACFFSRLDKYSLHTHTTFYYMWHHWPVHGILNNIFFPNNKLCHYWSVLIFAAGRKEQTSSASLGCQNTPKFRHHAISLTWRASERWLSIAETNCARLLAALIMRLFCFPAGCRFDRQAMMMQSANLPQTKLVHSSFDEPEEQLCLLLRFTCCFVSRVATYPDRRKRRPAGGPGAAYKLSSTINHLRCCAAFTSKASWPFGDIQTLLVPFYRFHWNTLTNLPLQVASHNLL